MRSVHRLIHKLDIKQLVPFWELLHTCDHTSGCSLSLLLTATA